MSPVIKCAEAIKDQSVKEAPDEGWEAVLFEEQLSLGSESSKTMGEESEEMEIDIMIRMCQWEELLNYIDTNPDCCFLRLVSKESKGNLVLHEVCKAKGPINIIKALVAGHKESVAIRGRKGYLPLHYACASGCSGEIIAFLVREFPDSVHMADDSDHMLPIHLACREGVSETGIMALLSPFPDATLIQDAFGRTPLDFARNHSNEDARVALLDCLEVKNIWLLRASDSAMRLADLSHKKHLEGIEEAHKKQVSELEGDRQAEKKKMDDHFMVLEKRIAEQERKIAALQSTVNTQSAEIDSKSQDLTAVGEKLADTEAKYSKLVEDKATGEELSKNQIAKMESEFQTEKEQMTQKERDLKDKISSNETQIEELADQLKNRDSIIETKSHELELAAAKFAEMKAEYENTLSVKEINIESLESAMRLQAVDLSEKLEAVRSQVVSLETDVEAKVAELDAAALKLQETEEAHREQTTALMTTNAEHVSRIENLEKAMAEQARDLGEKLDSEKEHVAALAAELEITKGNLEATIASLQDANARIEILDAKLEAKKAELSSKTEEMEKLHRHLEQLNSLMLSIRHLASIENWVPPAKKEQLDTSVETAAEIVSATTKSLKIEKAIGTNTTAGNVEDSRTDAEGEAAELLPAPSRE